MLLRPHHAYCFHFIAFTDPSRGNAYEEARQRIELLLRDTETKIELQDMPDFLCQACSHLSGHGCAHPDGGEPEVKKWDLRIIEGLGLKPGQALSVAELRSLVKMKAPLSFCIAKCGFYRTHRCNPLVKREGV